MMSWYLQFHALICFIFLYIFIFHGVYFPYYFPKKLPYKKVVNLKDRFLRSYILRLWFVNSFCNQHLEIGASRSYETRLTST